MDKEIDFSPLSESERAAVEAELSDVGTRESKTPRKPPTGAEPAEVGAARLFGRAPDMFWRYCDAEGALVFCVGRWREHNGDKKILPLSWRDGEGWRFAHWPELRPLYNLNKISTNSSAPVVICEGEKAADAAACIFPKSIATTSSGGANASNKTDWEPLAGRRVMIWPDNDKAGAGYACAVAEILADLGAGVCILDAAALARQVHTTTPAGFDAADALAEVADVGELRKWAASLAKPFVSGPTYLSFGPYAMDASGLRVETDEGRGESKRAVEHWICAAFQIIGACRDTNGAAWGKVLSWRDGDGRQHVRHVADAALHGEPATLCAQLADLGLRIARDRQRAFVGYLSAVQVRRRVRLVSRTGWHEIEGRAVFVLPDETVGPNGGERVILDAAAHGPYAARGTADDWRDSVAQLANGHLLPVFAISAALAGPLLHLAAAEGGGVHFWAQSSQGKTTLLQMAASVWGRGDSGGYVRSWRATANGLEGAAASATDTALILDEVGEVDAREMGPALYALGNGSGKARAGRDGSLREPKTWRVLTISSGEVPTNIKIAEERGRRMRAGQLVRMLDVQAQRAHGVFDCAGPNGDAAAFAKLCKLAAASAYGTAGPAFVRRIIAESVSGSDVRAFVEEFIKARVPSGADGQVDRAAQRFGLVAAAGEFATAFGLTGWREGEARDAADWALAQWIAARGGIEPAETSLAVAAVRLFIESYGDARFDCLDDSNAKPVPNRAGWREGAGEARRWFIPTETWKHEVCAGLNADAVAKTLAGLGMLERAGDGLQPVKRIKGQAHRVRIVTPRIFDGGEG